jgi:hypothetical protein
VIRFLLRLYPPAWRARYGDELTDLVADTGLDPRSALDITRGAARERGRELDAALTGGATMTLGPAWRHPTGWALAAAILLAPTAVFALGSLLAYQLGIGALLGAMGSANDWLTAQPRIVDLLLVLAPLGAAFVALVPLIRFELRIVDGAREVGLGLRLKWLNLAIAMVGLGIGALVVWHIVVESVLELGP